MIFFLTLSWIGFMLLGYLIGFADGIKKHREMINELIQKDKIKVSIIQ